MDDTHIRADVKALIDELMQYLAAHDSRALKIIARLKKEAEKTNDAALLGYAYYRYAYYHYFVCADSRLFHRYVQLAIRYLLLGGDREYLACAYNLVAYEAQDHNCYDIALAYYKLALQVTEKEEGLAISGLVETSIGRLMTELGSPKDGRRKLRSAIKRLLPLTSMHFYHYNMIVNYADEALCSFLLDDTDGVSRVLPSIERHFDRADPNDKNLSRTYRMLPAVYHALLSRDERMIAKEISALCRLLRTAEEEETDGLVFELESLVAYMLSNGYLSTAKKLLDALHLTPDTENLTVAMRYASLQIQYAEKAGDSGRLKKSLLVQRTLQKRHKEERTRMYRYTTGLVEIAGDIARERERALEEHVRLQIQASTDALTNLPNRNDMNRRLTEILDRAETENKPFCVGIMDVDRFKVFNDSFGHGAGDVCLKKIGSVLNELAAAPGIYCARYGGDEFIISFAGYDPKTVKRLILDVQKKISLASSQKEDGFDVPGVSVSFGICHGKSDTKRQLWDYLSAADKALYRIKKQGGGKHSLILLR